MAATERLTAIVYKIGEITIMVNPEDVDVFEELNHLKGTRAKETGIFEEKKGQSFLKTGSEKSSQ